MSITNQYTRYDSPVGITGRLSQSHRSCRQYQFSEIHVFRLFPFSHDNNVYWRCTPQQMEAKVAWIMWQWHAVTTAQTLDLPGSKLMAAAREIQDLAQLLVTCAGKIRDNSGLQIKVEQSRVTQRACQWSLFAVILLAIFNTGWIQYRWISCFYNAIIT
jgi:hypothetical protein